MHLRVIMSDMVHECEHDVTGSDGTLYHARVYAEERDDIWAGSIEFVPSGGGAARWTGVETTQPSRDAVIYWASGLEAVYLEGALARAK